MAGVTAKEVKAKMDEALDALADTFDDSRWWGTTAFQWAASHHAAKGKPTYFERQAAREAQRTETVDAQAGKQPRLK